MRKDVPYKIPAWLTMVVAILVILVGVQGFFLYRLHRDSVLEETPQAEGQAATASTSSGVHRPGTLFAAPGTSPLVIDPFLADPDWDPFREIQKMREQMDQFFGDAFNHFEQSRPSSSWFDFEWPSRPRVDIRETEDAYNVTVELPGAEASTIQTNLAGQTLQITAALNKQSEESSDDESMGKILRRERWVSRFERNIQLEHPVDADKMTTHFENGILKVHLPKSKGSYNA
jgi:HSP20 family protein